MPRVREIAEALPLFLEYFGLQIELARLRYGLAKAQIESDPERRLGSANQPASQNIFRCCARRHRLQKVEMMRSDTHEGGRLRDTLVDAKAAVPVERLDAAVCIHSCAREILTTCEQRHFAGGRSSKDFFSSSKRHRSPARKEQ